VKITTLEKFVLAFLIILTAFVGYTSVQAASQPKIQQQKQDKSKCFCNGLSLPQERQCPTMDDLDNGIILGQNLK
jgi:hypothetical protein